MTGDTHVQRVVIELRRGEGPMAVGLLAEGQDRPQRSRAVLEAAGAARKHAPAGDQAVDTHQEDDQ
jgi:hypothetical protein